MVIYRHFKGSFYRIIGYGKSSEDQSEQILYQSVSDDCDIWVRPQAMWGETVTNNGRRVKRFEQFDVLAAEKLIDKVAWLYTHNGKVLSARSRGKDVFYLPGGKREQGETDLECLCREISEELSVTVDPKTAQLYGKYYAQAHEKPQGVFLQMTCYQCSFTGELKPSNEIEEIAWLCYADRDRVSPIDKIIFDELFFKGLII